MSTIKQNTALRMRSFWPTNEFICSASLCLDERNASSNRPFQEFCCSHWQCHLKIFNHTSENQRVTADRFPFYSLTSPPTPCVGACCLSFLPQCLPTAPPACTTQPLQINQPKRECGTTKTPKAINLHECQCSKQQTVCCLNLCFVIPVVLLTEMIFKIWVKLILLQVNVQYLLCFFIPGSVCV